MSNMNTELEAIEIYPKIVVYKNTFNDIEGIYSMLRESENHTDDMVLSDWTQWSRFGHYLAPVIPNKHTISVEDANNIKAETEVQKKQKDFVVQLITNFYKVTEDYALRYGLDTFNKPSPLIKDHYGQDLPAWQQVGPTVCKYHISNEKERVGMAYHSDYIREKSQTPGYQFAFTALAYFNDDYEGGELDFCIGNKLFKYKPKAGDYIVFPSGHPDILTEDGTVYLHGVMPAEGTHKYFSRMYWQYFYPGSEEWFANEEKFGVDVWKEMQPQLEEAFRMKYPARNEIKEGIRIQ